MKKNKRIKLAVKPPPSNWRELLCDVLSDGNPLMDLWVAEACTKFAEIIRCNEGRVRALMQDGPVQAEGWIGCAKTWQDRSEQMFARNKKAEEPPPEVSPVVDPAGRQTVVGVDPAEPGVEKTAVTELKEGQPPVVRFAQEHHADE